MKGTRFDPNNCVALCRDCHTIWEKQQNEEYRAFMINWLGLEEYEAVEKRARTMKKMTDAILDCMRFLQAEKDLSFG